VTASVGGLQMLVDRTYDSTDKRVGDFGVGWRVAVTNFRVSANRALGAGGWVQYDANCFFGLCLTAVPATTPHFVTVPWPDAHQEIFDFTPTGGTNIFNDAGAAFAARPGTGTTSTLAPVSPTSLGYDYAGNLDDGSGPYSPTQFQLTTNDGRV